MREPSAVDRAKDWLHVFYALTNLYQLTAVRATRHMKLYRKQ